MHPIQLNHVKFLLNLHFLHERLNIKINDSLKEHSFKEKYYLIKNNIINKFKEIYKYNELLQALNTNEIKKLINEYKKDTLYIQEIQMEELSEKILKMIGKKYYDLIQNIPNKNELAKLDFKIEKKYYRNNTELFYYTDCQLIDGEMIKFFPDKKQILEESLVNCTFGENAVFLSFGKLINIGKLDNNYIFNTEMIIKLKNEKSIDSIFNQIKQFNYNLYKENLKFTQINFNGNHPFDYEIFIISKENEIILNKEEEQPSLTKIVIAQSQQNTNQIFRGTIYVNQSVKNLILFFIDYKDLQMKSKNFLKDNYKNNICGYYYLLNYQWFLKYLEVYNLTNLFQYLMKGNIIETIKNYDRLSSDEKISEIMMIINKWNPNIINSRNDNVNNIALKNNNLLNLKFDYFHPHSDINFKYYYDFFLVKKEAYEALIKDFGLNYHIMNYCYIGDNSIFIYLNNDNKYTLQIGHLSTNNYYFSIDIFLDFNSKKMFEEGLNLLMKEGSVKFWKTNLIIKDQNDCYSPIFDQNQNIIGNAFMVNKTNSKVDYQNIFINNNLKTLVLFYLENENLKRILKTNNINKFRKYYLINTNWLKEFKNTYGYNNLLNEFTKCPSLVEMVKNLKGDEKLSITEKRLCFLIKSLPLNININYNKTHFDFIKNAQIEPSSELYQFQNNNFLNYYNNFEIISEEIYNRIFGNSQSKDINLDQQKNNYVNCIFFEDIIMIELSRYVSGIEDYVIEAGYLNNNSFIPKYILIYKEQRKFLEHINEVNRELGIKKFYQYLNFNKGCSLPLYLGKNNLEIGKIYNLEIKFPNNNPAKNMINNNIRFNNNNNFNNNNFNNNFNNNNINNNFNNNNNNFNNNNINNNFNNNNNNFINNQFINNQNIQQQINFNNNNQIGNFAPMMPINNFQKNNQNTNNNSPKIPISSIKKDFPKPPLMGLKNVGATCYMNATLQCFSQIDSLVDYFKYKPYIEVVIKKYSDQNKLCLTESFKELIENLWPSNPFYIKREYVSRNSNNSYFAPYIFKEKISAMNELFKGVQANDSKDLVNFIIMTLHEEMNRAEKKGPNNNDFMNNIMVQTNKQLVLQNFLKSFQEENKSKISDLFYAQNNTMTQCQQCKEIKYNFQTYFFLIFPLEEVRKFNIEYKKNQFIQTYNYMNNMNPVLFQQMLNNFLINIQNQNSVNIYTCFEYSQKVEYFMGENAMYCNRCNAQCPASYMTKLYTGPQILIVILNRGIGIQFKVKLEFNQTLDLSKYIEEKRTGYLYNLIGVVTHMGESGASGHFIACCKSPIDGVWYRYNDDLVSQVYNFKQEIMDYAMPYILFFQKVKQ